MRHLRSHAGAMLIAGLTALPAGAESYQFSNSVYTLPPGWERGAAEHDYQLLRLEDDTNCAGCYFYIGRSTPAAGSLKSFLSKNKRMFLDPENGTGIANLTPISLFEENGRPMAMQSFMSRGNLMYMLGFQVKDRYEIIGFEGDASTIEEAGQVAAMFKTVVPAYTSSVRFVSDGADPVMPPPQPGPYDGAYFGTWLMQSMGMDMLMRMDIQSSLYVFWPNGYFYDGTPPFGMAPPDPAMMREPTFMDYGVYRLDGAEVHLTYANGETDTLTVEDGGLNDGRATVYPVQPLPDGSMIEGTISSSYASSFGAPGMMSQGGFSSSSYTTFRKDGTFGGESSSTSFGSFGDGMGGTSGGYSAGSEDGHSGTYAIKDGLITRRAPDGTLETTPDLIFNWDGEIFIGLNKLEKE